MRTVIAGGDGFEDADGDPDNDATDYSETIKSNPWTLGLSKNLGGGATLNFEHSEPSSDEDASTAIWLQVDF